MSAHLSPRGDSDANHFARWHTSCNSICEWRTNIR